MLKGTNQSYAQIDDTNAVVGSETYPPAGNPDTLGWDLGDTQEHVVTVEGHMMPMTECSFSAHALLQATYMCLIHDKLFVYLRTLCVNN